jgi:hypothetical protein
MDEWMRLPVTQLKRLVKSRAGRVAELQMEIKILEGLIERKVRDGDLGGSPPRKANPKNEEAKGQEKGVKEEAEEEEKPAKEPELNKDIKPSSDHAFKEID